MKSDNQQERAHSILGEEEAKEQVRLTDEQKVKMTSEERKKVRFSAITAGISLLVVVAVFVVGAIYGSREQKDQAARAPRESTPTFYGSLEQEDLEEGKITSVITQAYYTVENGMMVTIGFSNDMDTDEHISRVIVALYTQEDTEIAKAASASMRSDFIVSAGGTNEVTMYIKPDYVSVTDDPLQKLRYEITVEHETQE